MKEMESELGKMNASQYKQYHEAFMQNNHGSTALHTFLCIFFTIQCSLYCAIGHRRPVTQQYLWEYVVIVMSLIFAHTILADYIPFLNIIVFVVLLFKFVQYYPQLEIIHSFKKLNGFEAHRIQSVTIIRALTYLITVFCILAVDFQCFPRHLAKTEQFGYSLMDTGVGLFVLISGVVHKDLKTNSIMTILRGNAKFIIILLCLGVARFWSVKQLDYQEHVTEYGVHWNFFFTLAVCKLVATVLLYCSNHPLLFSISTIILHEFLLWSHLQTWVFSEEPRSTILSANREGISSCLGYVSMYLFAAHFKIEINDRTVTRIRILYKLIIESILLVTVSNVFHLFRPASRTLANASYCLYLEATFTSIAAFMYVIEVLFQNSECKLQFRVPLLLSAVNSNGLLYFLIANLMTGMINLSMRTLLVPTSIALVIFTCYMTLSLLLSIFLFKKGVKL